MDKSIKDTFNKAENYMLIKKIEDSQSMRNDTVRVIMHTLNEKNEREKNHSVGVSTWSRKIGVAMDLSPRVLNEIETAGLMHDIGKITVTEEVLNKPGALTESEYNEVKKHPETGYQILKSVNAYSTLAEYALSHHERFDGNGYPRGLQGEGIPLISRIIAVADAFEAMVSDRPYRKGMGQEAAIQEIKCNSGTQFDPAIVDYFLTLF